MMLKERNYNLDLIRSIALLMVVSVHFIFYIGFNEVEFCMLSFGQLVIMNILYVLSKTCVPLFLILTGYLKSECSWNRGYYKGIIKILMTYLLASLLCIIYSKWRGLRGIKYALTDILGFKASAYAWYVAMYIGLFFMIPFLVMIWKNIESKRGKQILLLGCLFCTMAPSIFNIWSFENIDFLKAPMLSTDYNKLIPDFWIGMYPISYFFIGAYLKENMPKIKLPVSVGILILSTVFFVAFNIYRSYPGSYVEGLWNDWGGFEPTITAVLLFVVLYKVSIGKKAALVFQFVSINSLAAYLCSWMIDHEVYYRWLNVNNSENGLEWYLPVVISIFCISILVGSIVEFGAQRITSTVMKRLKGF